MTLIKHLLRALLSACARCSFGVLFSSCACVCVSLSGVLFSVGVCVCVCDLLIFLHRDNTRGEGRHVPPSNLPRPVQKFSFVNAFRAGGAHGFRVMARFTLGLRVHPGFISNPGFILNPHFGPILDSTEHISRRWLGRTTAASLSHEDDTRGE